MRVTSKQKSEIQFLESYGGFKCDNSEIDNYLQSTVYGNAKTSDKLSENRLRNTKTRFNLMLTVWLEDMSKGLLGADELMEDEELQHEYAKKCIARIRRKVKPKYIGSKDMFFLSICNMDN